jgi:tRNA(fMet)-specific endonuclease VapC
MALVGLLDTNILSAIMRDADGTLLRRIRATGADAYCTSVIVAGELRLGAERVRSERLKREVEEILEEITVVPFETPADAHYARIRAGLEQQGQPIGANDLFIAAHALALDLTLITGNIREFSRVPGLRLENWLD